MNNEGVSAVVGVILMVAITVVLAAVLYVLISNFGDEDSGNDNKITLNTASIHETSIEYSITTVSENLNYTYMTVKANGNEVEFTYTGSDIASPGDFITVNGLSPHTVYEITVVYENKLIGTARVTTLG